MLFGDGMNITQRYACKRVSPCSHAPRPQGRSLTNFALGKYWLGLFFYWSPKTTAKSLFILPPHSPPSPSTSIPCCIASVKCCQLYLSQRMYFSPTIKYKVRADWFCPHLWLEKFKKNIGLHFLKVFQKKLGQFTMNSRPIRMFFFNISLLLPRLWPWLGYVL